MSVAFVRLRDVSHIWDVIIQGAFYAIPILYPVALLPVKAAKVLMLNPMAQIIQDARYVLVTPSTITVSGLYGTQLIRLVPYGIVVFVAFLASWYFKKRSKYFAEEV